MASLNRVVLIGNITRDIDLRYIQSGTALAKFGLAVNEKYNDKETVAFVDITVWSKQAENCAEYLRKGSQVAIDGKLTYSKWETDDGQKRSKLEVTAERVVFLGGKSEGAPAVRGSTREPGSDDLGGVPF